MNRRQGVWMLALAGWVTNSQAALECRERLAPDKAPRLDPGQPIQIELTWEGRGSELPPESLLALLREHRCTLEHVRVETPGRPDPAHRLVATRVGSGGPDPLLALASQAAALASGGKRWSVQLNQAAPGPGADIRPGAPRGI